MTPTHGYNGKYDRYGRPVRNIRRKQKWTIGQTVNIGFIKGLTIKGMEKINGEDAWILENAKGVRYGFIAHSGLFRI